ncbi:MAG: hypothetical protein AAGA77_17340 [Bacteroidota bacterium]
MRFNYRHFLNTLIALLFFNIITFGQNIQSVDYLLKYDANTCWYDFYIIILDGFAEGAGQRTQFNSQISIVKPTGTTIAFANKYMPLQNNQTYNGTVPLDWVFGPTVSDPGASPGNDFVSITPSLVPTSQYNNIYAGDTIKLFSLNITGDAKCGQGIRLFENGADPTSNDEGMNGADYSNGFTVGGFTQLYNGNAPTEGPEPPSILELTDNSDSNIDINLETSGPACQGPVEYLWSGPAGFTSTSEDVLINPATSANYGEYEVVIKDKLGCSDTTSILVEEGDAMVNELTAGNLILNATFEHTSAHLNISGDDNHNSTFVLEYRLVGTTAFLPAAQSMRAFPQMIVDGTQLNENFHAATAMFLQPNSSYDLRITIDDPEGGGIVIDTSLTTKAIPVKSNSGNTLFVVPGNGGGTGSSADPFLGIQDAVDAAQPGDVIEVADGVYGIVTITNAGTEGAPIVLRSTNLHGAVIDGGNTSSGIVTVGSFSDSIQHIIIDGFEIKNGSWGIDAQNTQFLTIKNNKINAVDFGFYNRRENGWEHDQYITNNEIIGRTNWPQTNGAIPAERGIDIRGNRNVVSYNTVSDFGDGISTDGPPYKVSYALDIHHNFINRVVDDLIEIDGVLSNARVYRNRGFNGRMGVSLAPVFGGPAYVFRNEFHNLETSTFKMNRSPAGLYIVNNTSIKDDRGMTSPSGWQNTVFKNNAIVSSHYCFEEFGLVLGSEDEWNFNAYKSLRAGISGQPWFKWDNIQYDNVAILNASGKLGVNSREIELSDFEMASIPSAYTTEVLPQNIDAIPSSGSDLINNGMDLDNIQMRFVTDGSPDIGAYEFGAPEPDFGHNFDSVCERIDLSARTWNGSVNRAWFLPQNWTPCGVPSEETNVVIPAGCTFYPYVNSNVEIKHLSILSNGLLEIQGALPMVRLVGE